MGLLPDTQNCGLRMRRECRERFPRHRRLAIPTCITARAHARCMPVSLSRGFLWSRWREKRSRHSRRMRNPQICVSGKRPMAIYRIWVRSWNCGCLVTWFCYQLIAKPGNKTATVLWSDPYTRKILCDGLSSKQFRLASCTRNIFINIILHSKELRRPVIWNFFLVRPKSDALTVMKGPLYAKVDNLPAILNCGL